MTLKNTGKFSPRQWLQTTKRLLVSGLQVLAVSTTLLVSGALLLVAVLTFSLLMILIQSKMLNPIVDWHLTRHGRGSRQDRFSD